MKRFETQVGNEWRGWVADARTKIVKKAGLVVIDQDMPATETTPAQHIKLTFNLSVLPVYAAID